MPARWWGEVEQPSAWECVIWRQVLPALEEGGKTASSYYVMAQEAVQRCAVQKREEGRWP